MSAALGLLLGDRRRAVLLAVLLLGRGVRRADDGDVDAGREDGQDRRDDELDEEEPARGGSPGVVRLVRAIDATAGSSDAAADAATVFARGFESFQDFFVALYSEPVEKSRRPRHRRDAPVESNKIQSTGSIAPANGLSRRLDFGATSERSHDCRGTLMRTEEPACCPRKSALAS